MFVRLSQPEGLPILIKANRIVAVARTEDGGSRVFLGGPLSCLVAEDEDAVVRAIETALESGPT